MNSKEYIESGILELFVYGKLSEEENKEVLEMAAKHPEVQDEIIAIEKAVVSLSENVAPYLSVNNFEKIRVKLFDKSKVVPIQPKKNISQYLGWVAAAVLILGFGIQLFKLNQSNKALDNLTAEKIGMQQELTVLTLQKQETDNVLAVIRDVNTVEVALAGQQVAPEALATAYYNKSTKEVYIDAAGLPAPPEGMVYQVWALQLEPVLTPTSIGLLETYAESTTKVIKVDNANEAQAFGITLEPAGGSPSPTLEQLYTLGKV
jgi:anti-sigma-K factor RskA